MNAQYESDTLPSMSEFVLRVATPADAEALSALATRTCHDTYGHLPAEDLQMVLTTAFTVDNMRKEIENPLIYTVLLFSKDDETTPCGYGMVHDHRIRIGDNDSAENYIELKRLYLDKSFHGQGAAGILMIHLMDYLREKQRKVVWLGVWENNFRAQKFYQKYGFEETGEYAIPIGTTEDRALLYTLK
ncbi:hypothetical protein Poli38472_005185 [Pythium oligandrum]|uniref:N-acetyltransferase domain-containing protein n=1 Tax=Pythium oligandrum TaxID=41045 RepID=A0A8K1FK87_PYTOL|nr:hypothetical protein Poli38472_005185 [Pythium oligandrum]|eukprot:TMW62567.1 hypothetical protein Poli38472_005185 [Pythium oligandrum]